MEQVTTSALILTVVGMMILLVILGVALSYIEKAIPNQNLPQVPGWWGRAIRSCMFRLLMVVLISYLYYITPVLKDFHVVNLSAYLSPFVGGIVGYLVGTFFDYWTHRFRHNNYFLWLGVHQIHHAPSRIQTVTSFYKHPTENILEVFVIAIISVALLGLDPIGAAWVQFWVILVNLIYHTNIKTPRWMGYFIQRPEMHLIHHARSVQYYNFADLPIWDILFGTFRNPEPPYPGPCGFADLAELKTIPMLEFQEVDPNLIAKKFGGKHRPIP